MTMGSRKRAMLYVLLAMTLALGALAGCASQQSGDAQKTSAVEEKVSQEADSTEAETAEADNATSDDTVSAAVDYHDPGEGYKLQQVVMLSRHNIRSPLSSNGSALAIATPHQWFNWTSEASELSLRGGVLETQMGEYVRTWLEAEGLVDHNWQPAEGEVRFYANSKQRTIATAQYFSSGMLPVANVTIETKASFDEMDPVFKPQLTFVSDTYNEAALAQIAELGGSDGMEGVAADLANNYELLADVCDYQDSEGYKSGELTDLVTTDTNIVLEAGAEPAMEGSLKIATQLADALVLQYYEETDPLKAGFGHDLTLDQWKQISKIKDVYGDVLFTTPLVSANVANPLLRELASELEQEGRKFTFLCGHDSNIGSALAALGVTDYELPNTIECKTPIGSKLVFERWANEDGNEFARVRLMYQSTNQLRNLTMLQNGEQPQTFDLEFDGLQKNADGLYAFDDLRERFEESIATYDKIVEEYGDVELAEAA